MPLADADELRLNVLLAQKPLAIKINESRLTLHALTPHGEAQVELQPNTKPDLYLKQVREFLSSKVLGSKGGYPIFLNRWTRMGQARDESLARLLLLGEDEAISNSDLARPNNQDVVISLLNTLGQYFDALNTDNRQYRDLQMWKDRARALLDEHHIPKPDNCPNSVFEFGESIMALSMVDETMVGPVFSVSDAIGTVMRKRIKPITDEINKHIDRLLHS